jgi:hypothetical protein
MGQSLPQLRHLNTDNEHDNYGSLLFFSSSLSPWERTLNLKAAIGERETVEEDVGDSEQS